MVAEALRRVHERRKRRKRAVILADVPNLDQ
jgi:hypothetical protein